ncbi:hypothetical protein C1645_744435 [Glomus cerebriforme]|uniref:Uncharacterized protein n=1 Tax=Glomus cerebriforme TaxID=658196 RepID=A0A397S9R9_9GLOM|nr:hypothetical protein C1645_744435 [Glomus cerebriforme]
MSAQLWFETLRMTNKKYIDNQSDIKGRVSIPNFLELNVYENAIYLHNTVSHLHDGVFLSSKAAYKASTKMDKFAKSLNKRALELDEEFFKDDDRPNKKFYQVNKYLKRAKSNLEKLKNSSPSYKQNENERQKELLDEKIKQLKNEKNLGSSIICSTESFLSLILTQQCSCRNNDISQKKCKISSGRLSVKIVIKCKKCKEIFSFQNEPPDTNYTKAFAAATLCGGLNHQEFQNSMLTFGITKLPSKSIYHKYQKSMSEDIKNVASENAKKALYVSIEDAKKKEKIL